MRNDQTACSMSLVPRFDEKNFKTYLSIFKKVAENMEWPKYMYCLLLQSILKGKAKDLYCALSTQPCGNYKFVKKKTNLQTYELVLEAYRQRFGTF